MGDPEEKQKARSRERGGGAGLGGGPVRETRGVDTRASKGREARSGAGVTRGGEQRETSGRGRGGKVGVGRGAGPGNQERGGRSKPRFGTPVAARPEVRGTRSGLNLRTVDSSSPPRLPEVELLEPL